MKTTQVYFVLSFIMLVDGPNYWLFLGFDLTLIRNNGHLLHSRQRIEQHVAVSFSLAQQQWLTSALILVSASSVPLSP